MAAAVAAAVVVAGLYGAHLGPFAPAPLASPQGGVASNTALASAVSVARATAPFNWTPVSGIGLDANVPIPDVQALLAAAGGVLGGCNLTPMPTPPVSIPAFRGSLSAGVAPFWLYLFLTAVGSPSEAGLAVGVVNSTATALAEFTGRCLASFGSTSAPLVPSTGYETSVQAVANPEIQSNVSRFVSAFGPGNISAFFVLSSASLLGATVYLWSLAWTSCPLIATQATNGTTLTAEVLGTGSVIVPPVDSTASCPTTGGALI